MYFPLSIPASFRAMPCFAAALVALLLPSASHAQKQPDIAENEQNEVVNIDRPVDSRAESFKILRSGDKSEINRYVTKVYPLKNANPYEILPYLRTAASLEKGTISTATISPEGGPTQRWIQVNVPEFQIPFLDQAVAAYDVPNFTSSGGDIKFSYRTKYRSATELAALLKSTSISADGTAIGDAATNTVWVSDSPSDFRRDLAQLQFFDVPTPQVDLELSIIELTDIDQTSLGLDWDAWKASLGGSYDVAAGFDRVEPDSGVVSRYNYRYFNGLLSADATTAAQFLNYLVDQGKAKIHTRTNVTVATGKVATISSGTQVPEFQYVYNKDMATGAPRVEPGKNNLVETVPPPNDPSSEGLSIRFAPIIAAEGASMDVELFMRSPVGVNRTGGTIYSEQRLANSLSLVQNQLYKFGGINRSTEATETKGFPLLGKIPVLKYLFSNEQRIFRTTQYFVFLKPTWAAPRVPDAAAMQGDALVAPKVVEGILKENPNVGIAPEDQAMLQRYFEMREK